MLLLSSLIISVLAASLAQSQHVAIVREGKPLVSIVLPHGANPLEQEAALDLKWAVHEATGAEIHIAESPDHDPALIPIQIGRAAAGDAAPKFSEQLKTLPWDGGTILSDGRGLVIAGPTPAGTAHAVATILMEDIGVRMYYPESLFTIVPKRSNLTIRPRTVRAWSDFRIWSGVTGSDVAGYLRRNRITDHRWPAPHFGFGHNLANIISVAKFGKEHPEYFAFREGSRQVKGKDVADTPQPCFSNPDVVRLSIEAARQYFDANPTRDTYSLCVNDNPWYCECEKCAAKDKPYRDLPVGRQYAESYNDYVSQVAEAVAKTHPNRFIGVYAYWNAEQPPRNRKRLPDNVVVELTLDTLQHYDPGYRDKDEGLVRNWSGYTKHLCTYVYYGLGWFTPRTSPGLVAENLRFNVQNRIGGMYCEAFPFWAWSGPMLYVASRLQWDATADVERIMDEFHRDCFGPQAAEMRAYHAECEHYWLRPRKGRWFEGLENLSAEAEMSDPAPLREAKKHLEAAMTSATDSTIRKRIEWLKKGFDFSYAVAEAFDAAKLPASSPDRTGRLREAGAKVERLMPQISAMPAYKHSYYQHGERFENKWHDWFKAVSTAGTK